MALSEATVKNARPKPKAYKLSDELGMFLLVNPNGSRLWRFKYRFRGKEKLLALGGYPEVSLKRAREYRDAARQLLKEDKDPATERKIAKRTARLHAENAFEQVAREFVQQQKARWSKAHAADVLHRLEIYIFPDLGRRPIAEIAALELLDVVRKLEARGAADLSHRMLQTCGQVFRYGVVTGRCAKDIAADLRGALVPHVQKHQPSIPSADLPELLQAIQRYDRGDVARVRRRGEPMDRAGSPHENEARASRPASPPGAQPADTVAQYQRRRSVRVRRQQSAQAHLQQHPALRAVPAGLSFQDDGARLPRACVHDPQ
jgi:Arm DNA-binding domain